jgi:hypothetical protein
MAGGRFKSLVKFGGHETNYPSCYYLDRFVWDQRCLNRKSNSFSLCVGRRTAGNQWIVADREIMASTSDEFAIFLKDEDVKIGARIEVYLNSPGGSLLAGIKLGEIIRRYGLGTRVASTVPLNIGSGSFKFETDGAGNCYSACSFAFLGGKWRIAADQSIGVHQRYTDEALNNAQAKAFTAVDISAEQIIAGILADCIVRMGVDARFLTRASMAGPTEIYKFSSDEMTKFAITWNDVEYSDWTLEPYKNGLIAVSKTKNSENTATLFCRKDRTLRLLLSLINRFNLSIESIIDNPTTVNLFGTDIQNENISARIEQGFIKIEFKLPDGLDPEAPKSTVYIPGTKSKGLGADGPYRYWFDHDLPDKGFKQVSKLVRRNCI